MSFFGNFPYGTDGGPDGSGDESGTQSVRGSGVGVEYSLVTDDYQSVRDVRTFTELKRITSVSGVGNIPTSGGNPSVTLIITKNGTIVDNSAGTLNVNPSPDVSFLTTDSPAGTVNLSLNYPAAGGINGSAYFPARADHLHSTVQALINVSSRDEIASGQVTGITQTSYTSFLSTTITLPNDGRTYVVEIRGGATTRNATNNIWNTVKLVGTGVVGFTTLDAGNIQSADRWRQCPDNRSAVVGSGQVITAQLMFKVDAGSGQFGTAYVYVRADPVPFC